MTTGTQVSTGHRNSSLLRKTMEPCTCAICHDGMTVATGHATLSCGHTYHLCCIVNAFCYQEGLPSRCPLCRQGVASLSDIWWMTGEEAAPTPAPALTLMPDPQQQPHPLQRAKRWQRVGPVEWARPYVLNPEEEEEPLAWADEPAGPPPPETLVEQTMGAATRLQAAWRGFRARILFSELLSLI